MNKTENRKKKSDRKTILIISFTDLENDPRVKRQIKHLKNKFNIITIGRAHSKSGEIKFIEIRPVFRTLSDKLIRSIKYKLRKFEEIYWTLYDFKSVINELKNTKFDLIIANDIDTIPFSLKIANGAKVILDCHEYSPMQFNDRFIWRFFLKDFNKYLCKTYFPFADKIITVSNEIANEYKLNYNIDPVVITNASEYKDCEPKKVKPDRIKIITHGVSNPNRKLELMMKVMDYTDDRFHLDMMLVPTSKKYYEYIKKIAARKKNISVIPPVKESEIISTINDYDLSFLIFKPTTINLKLGLFNKTFESIQARLALISGTSPLPQVEIIRKYNCGINLKSYKPKNIAHILNELTADEIMLYKKNAGKAAKILTNTKNMKKLDKIINEFI